MGINYSPKIVTDGLVLCLDAANPLSYPGSGNTWFDLSGNNRHYTIDANYTSFNNNKYFDVLYQATTGWNFTGPPSNTFNFNSDVEHTIFSFMDIATAHASSFFYWGATPNIGSDNRAIFSHFPYGSSVIYDVAGCCASTQRISIANLGSTLTNQNIFCATWRTRKISFPNREIFINGISALNSGNNTTATVTWDNAVSAGLCNRWAGKLYNFIVYNRGLSNEEIVSNYNALKGRFGL